MVYIEKKSNDTYNLVKSVTFLGENKRLNVYIGKPKSNLSNFYYYKKHITILSEKEIEYRIKALGKFPDLYNKKIVEKVETLSVKINNFIEANKTRDETLFYFSKKFIYNSNNIEGSKIPPDEVEKILERGDEKYSDKNEIKEVKNSYSCFIYLQTDFKYNVQSIKRLYYILTKNLFMQGNNAYPRGFKEVRNVVGNSQTSSPEEVENDLDMLLTWYKQNKKKIHPLILAFDFHLKYEQIHPFLDGNGRTGRLLMNKILMDQKYFPIIIYKENRLKYFNSIEKAINGDKRKYYHFLLTQMEKTYNEIKEYCEKAKLGI